MVVIGSTIGQINAYLLCSQVKKIKYTANSFPAVHAAIKDETQGDIQMKFATADSGMVAAASEPDTPSIRRLGSTA